MTSAQADDAISSDEVSGSVRFTEQGPSIPDTLLEARDDGEVVFLCGAGVSAPAGLPMFGGLTERVINALGPPAGHPARHELQAGHGRIRFDQVFSLLEEEYPSDDVRAAVEDALGTPSRGGSEHDVVARLSTDASGRPRLVTTNFDRLFDAAPTLAGRSIHTPERFPDPTASGGWEGVVHLHGAVGRPTSPLVLSQEEFGRAYLAPPAPAAAFVAALLERHVVVLLGYRAEDPPMEYLLRGLRRVDADHRGLYALVSGEAEAAEAAWRPRGVAPIAYGDDHDRLWETLALWADRADDPVAWRRAVVARAAVGPRALRPFERGQVAHLVRSAEGARLFAEADPPAPAEWLCVLDRARRRNEPTQTFGGEEPSIDPLALYGLDDDPPRRANETRTREAAGDHLLTWRESDERPVKGFALTDPYLEFVPPLPRRLHSLAWWVAARLDEPAAAWWLARQSGLHPAVRDAVRHRLDRGDLPEVARQAIRLALEAATGGREHDLAWARLRGRAGREGWTPPNLEELRRLARPRVRLRHTPSRASPPTAPWEDGAGEVGPLDVDLPDPSQHTIEVPDESLWDVCRVMTDALRLFVWRLVEVDRRYFRLAAFTPDNRPGRRRIDATSSAVRWSAGLLDRLAERDPEALRAEATAWPRDEPYVFDRVRWHLWRNDAVFPGGVLSPLVAALPDRTLWEPYHRRDAMLTLAGRWSDLDAPARVHVEAVLLGGDEGWEDIEDGRLRRDRQAAATLRWLQRQGCDLSAETADRLAELIGRLPEWDEAWADAAVADLDGRTGWVRTDTDPGDLGDLPLGDIVREALARTNSPFWAFVEHRPFQGLIAARPARALAALRHEARRDCYPTDLWRELLNAWPKTVGPWGDLLLTGTLAALPPGCLVGLSDQLSPVFEGVLPRLRDRAPSMALRLFDKLVSSLVKAAGSSVPVADRERPGSVSAAWGSPFGSAAEFLLRWVETEGEESATDSSDPPPEVLERMEGLLRLPDVAAHAAVILGAWTMKLCTAAPDWVARVLRPLFDPSDPLAEAAWNGLLSRMEVDEALLRDLAPSLIALFPWPSSWSTRDETPQKAARLLVLACLPVQERPPPVAPAEARAALQQADEAGRRAAIGMLDEIGDSEPGMWTEFVVPFLRSAWPRERRFRTPDTTRALVNLAAASGEAFPVVAGAVRPLLAPVVAARDDLLWRFRKDAQDEELSLAQRHPHATLLLLDDALRQEEVPGLVYGDDVLDMIAEAQPELRRTSKFRSLACKLGRG